jgi:RES domain
MRTIDPMNGPWYRSYTCRFGTSLYYNRKVEFRFNAPDGSYGVLYAGAEPHCVFIERFGDSRNADGEIEIDEIDYRGMCFALIHVKRALRVAQLTGNALSYMGADNRLWSGADYPRCRRWSRALWSHPDEPDGLYYPSRHTDACHSLAIFDRARDAIEEELLGSLVARVNATVEKGILSAHRVNIISSP